MRDLVFSVLEPSASDYEKKPQEYILKVGPVSFILGNF
jgi:hypothetical protein